MSGEKVSRRRTLEIAAATVLGIIVGGVAGWFAKPREVMERLLTTTVTRTETVGTASTVTTTVTSTVTKTVTAAPTAPPATTTTVTTATTPTTLRPTKEEVLAWYAEKAKPWKGTTLKTVVEVNPPMEWNMNNAFAEFCEACGIKVDIEKGTHETVYQKEVLDMERGTGIYDFFFDDQDMAGTWAIRGWYVPLNEFMNDHPELVEPWIDLDDIFTLPLVSDTAGNIIQFPNEGVPSFYMYRYDLFTDPKERSDFKSKYGRDLVPPMFDDEYEEIAEFFTRPDVPLYGHMTFYKYAHYVWHHFLAVDFGACSNGPLPWTRPVCPWGLGVKKVKIGDREVECACLAPVEKGGMIDSPQMAEAFRKFHEYLKYAPPGALEMEWMAEGDAWDAGILAQAWFEWPHLIPNHEDPSRSKIVGKWAVAPCPVSRKYHKPLMPKTYLDIEGFLLPYCSKQKEISYLLMQYTISKPTDYRKLLDIGFCTRSSSINDPEVEKIYSEKSGGEPKTWLSYLHYWRNKEEMKYAIGTDPAIIDYPTICERVLPWCAKAFSGELSPEEAVKGMAEDLDKLFKELGYIE